MSDYVIFSNRGDADYSEKSDLTFQRLKELNPKYVFFPFWSEYIPSEIYENFECIVFHMTDLPFGRGGNPLQNLIVRGYKKTKVSALKCVKEIDAGSIYLKKDLDISYGSADEIYDRAYDIIIDDMIPHILKYNPMPIPQKGEVVVFERWRCNKSDIARALDTDYEGIGK